MSKVKSFYLCYEKLANLVSEYSSPLFKARNGFSKNLHQLFILSLFLYFLQQVLLQCIITLRILRVSAPLILRTSTSSDDAKAYKLLYTLIENDYYFQDLSGSKQEYSPKNSPGSFTSRLSSFKRIMSTIHGICSG